MGGSNVFQYAPNPTGWIDPFGLIHEKAPGHNVYELYDINPQTGQLADKPYYVGITDNIRRRTTEHENSGRLTKDGSTRLVARHENITYGQARGYEQALIEQHGTKTGTRGVNISQSNRGNKINGFDVDSPTRPQTRQKYFLKHYNQMRKSLKGGCT